MAPLHETLIELAMKRSFLIPSNECYGHTAGFYDFGPVGCLIKRRLENSWRSFFLYADGFHEIETVHVLPEIVLKASGHAENFADPLTTCKKCKNKFRADHVLEKALKKKFDRVKPEELSKLILDNKVPCPQCGGELAGVGWFNLMFKTNIGPIEGNIAYCRPETAQGIFMDFPRIFRNYGSKLPMAIGQVGRSYRNEISPRQGLLRLREFTQMEIEYFFNPKNNKLENFSKFAKQKLRILGREGQKEGTAKVEEMSAEEAVAKGIIPNEIMAYFMAKQTIFYEKMGVPFGKMYFRHLPKDETPHYSLGNFDLEVETSYGAIETIGNAYRTDFDLMQHAKMSGQEMSVFLEEEKAKIVPHVVEPSMGVDRLFWCVLEHCYRPKSAEKDWEWFDLPPAIVPYDAGVFPLMKKDGLAEKAKEIVAALREKGLNIIYWESASIGRRYAKADEIGVPYALTIDYDSLTNNDVTIRFRNDGKQMRLKISELAEKISEYSKAGKVTG